MAWSLTRGFQPFLLFLELLELLLHPPDFISYLSSGLKDLPPYYTSGLTNSQLYLPPGLDSPTNGAGHHLIHHLLCMCDEGSCNAGMDWSTQGDRVRDWPGSRKGMATMTGFLLNLARNFSFLSLSLLLLLGHLYLKSP